MATYPQLALPEAWKPLFQALDDAGWELQEAHPAPSDWTARPILCYEAPSRPWLAARYLSFIVEPLYCGNSLQEAGFTVVTMSATLPQTRSEAEACCLSLVADWEDRLPVWIHEFTILTPV